MQSLVSCGQQLELAVNAVLQSVTTHEASALEAARFAAVSALEAARRFAVPMCQPSWHERQVPKGRYIGQHAASYPPHLSLEFRCVLQPDRSVAPHPPFPMNVIFLDLQSVRLASLWICSQALMSLLSMDGWIPRMSFSRTSLHK
jgi:hypothetical protein